MAMTDRIDSVLTLWATPPTYLLIIIGIVLVVAGILLFLIFRPKKPKVRAVSDAVIEGIIRNLGGIGNITHAAQDGARLKFTIVDLDKCHLNEIREQGAVGVFVSGNAVKFMLASNADHLIGRINELKEGE
jgi:phosphotransferase system IIB component